MADSVYDNPVYRGIEKSLQDAYYENARLRESLQECRDACIKDRRDLWEKLHAIEIQDETVAAHLNMSRNQGHRAPGTYPDLNPAALVALIEVLVKRNAGLRRMVSRYAERLLDPPVLVVDKANVGHLSMLPGDLITAGEPGTVITADEWPKTERSLIECSPNVYFRDFLRSFWKRLTKRRLA